MNYSLGLDIGATYIKAGLIDEKNKITKKIKIPTQTNLFCLTGKQTCLTGRQDSSFIKEKSKDFVLERIFFAIEKLFSKEVNPIKCSLPNRVKKIGIGITGSVDCKKGILISSPNLFQNFKNIPLKKILEEKYKRPVQIDNDGNCFALAESILGAGKNYNFIVGITLGTGIGSGIVLNKKLYRGANNNIEMGHMIISFEEKKRICECGSFGHWEVFASSTGMSNLYREFTGQKRDTFFIAKKFQENEKAARKTIEIASQALLAGLVNIVNILNPEIIVIGGGLVEMKSFFEMSSEKFKKIKEFYPFSSVKIVKSKLKDEAGILGATL